MATITDDKLIMFDLVDQAFPVKSLGEPGYSAKANLDARDNRRKLKITIARM